jgi:hypothetical protein
MDATGKSGEIVQSLLLETMACVAELCVPGIAISDSGFCYNIQYIR